MADTTTPALGIETLKQALKTVSDFRKQLAKTKKFTLLSIFGFIDDFLAIGSVITSWKTIVAEWKDRDEAEIQQLLDYAKNELGIPAGNVQKFVEDAFKWILTTIDLVESATHL